MDSPEEPGSVPAAGAPDPVERRLPGFREIAAKGRHDTIAGLVASRRAAGLSQTEVAARMGTSQSTVARLEAGDVDPRLSTLQRYADALGTGLDVQLRAADPVAPRPHDGRLPDTPLPRIGPPGPTGNSTHDERRW